MAKKQKRKAAFPTGLSDMSVEQLMSAIELKVASGEVPWPLKSGSFPFPRPVPPQIPSPPWGPCPWPPFCPNCGTGINNILQPAVANHASTAAPASFRFSSQASSSVQTLRIDRILEELIAAIKAWKPRLSGTTEDTELDDMAASGDGRYDVISAVDRWSFFINLGLSLHYFHIGSDKTIEDVAETIGKLLEDAGHVVLS